jgi:hypothetical protein
MKTTLRTAAALALCAVLLAGNARAETEAGTAPAPGSAAPPPGIIVTPPKVPSDTQQSCPDTGHKLELVV